MSVKRVGASMHHPKHPHRCGGGGSGTGLWLVAQVLGGHHLSVAIGWEGYCNALVVHTVHTCGVPLSILGILCLAQKSWKRGEVVGVGRVSLEPRPH